MSGTTSLGNIFLLSRLALGQGCAISNYALITDNDQVADGKGSGVVNTNGKAKIIPSMAVRDTRSYNPGPVHKVW